MNQSPNFLIEPDIPNSFRIERLDKAELATEQPNRLNYHRLILIQSGSGELKIDESTFELAAPQILLMAKGQVYQFERGTKMTGYTLSFGDCFWERTPASASNCKAVLFNNASANQCLSLTLTELQDIAFLSDTLHKEFLASFYTNQFDAMAAYLKIIMIKLANVPLVKEVAFDSPDYLLYRKFMELLSTRYREYHEVGDYARLLGITARRLSELCRRCSGKNAKELINGQLVAEAKRSLQFSSRAVKEIAYQLSFGTPEQFSHFFKKNTRYSPAGYREHFVGVVQ